jgi:hypothetical protein
VLIINIRFIFSDDSLAFKRMYHLKGC